MYHSGVQTVDKNVIASPIIVYHVAESQENASADLDLPESAASKVRQPARTVLNVTEC